MTGMPNSTHGQIIPTECSTSPANFHSNKPASDIQMHLKAFYLSLADGLGTFLK